MNADDPTPPLCERCWRPILPGDRAVRLGMIRGSTLSGDVEWSAVWLHPYEPGQGCGSPCERAA